MGSRGVSRSPCCENKLNYRAKKRENGQRFGNVERERGNWARTTNCRKEVSSAKCDCIHYHNCPCDNSTRRTNRPSRDVKEVSYSFNEHSERSYNERNNSDSSYYSHRKSPATPPCHITNESSPLITLEDLDDIKRCFQDVDRDCDGWINAEELCCFMQLRDSPISKSNAENIVYNSDTCYHYSINRNQLIYLAGKYGLSTKYSVKLTQQEYNAALLSLRTSTTVENYLRYAYNYLTERNKEHFDGTVNYFEEKSGRQNEQRFSERIAPNTWHRQDYCTTDTSYDSGDFEYRRQAVLNELERKFKNTSSAMTMGSNKSNRESQRASKSEEYLDFNSLKRDWEDRIQKELINIRQSEETFRRLRRGSDSRSRPVRYGEGTNYKYPEKNRTQFSSKKPSRSNFSLARIQSRSTETESNSTSASSLKSESSIQSNATAISSKSRKKNKKDKKISKKWKSKKKKSKSKQLSDPKLSESKKSIKETETITPKQSIVINSSTKEFTVNENELVSSSKIKLPSLKSKSENPVSARAKSRKSLFNKSATKSEIINPSPNNSNEDLSRAKGDQSKMSQTSVKNVKSKGKKSKRSKSIVSMKRNNSEEILEVLPSPSSRKSESRRRIETQNEEVSKDISRSQSTRKQKSSPTIKIYEKDGNSQKIIGSSKSVLSASRKPSQRNVSSSKSFTNTRDLTVSQSDPQISNETTSNSKKRSRSRSKRKKTTSEPISLPTTAKSVPALSASNVSLKSKPFVPPIPPPLPSENIKSKSKRRRRKDIKSKSVSGTKSKSQSKSSVSSTLSSISGVSVENKVRQALIGRATSIFPGNSKNSTAKKKVTFKVDSKSPSRKSGLSSRMTM